MKKIELGKGEGKTTHCLKRALKLVKKGENVLYIIPREISCAHGLLICFIRLLEKYHIDYNRIVYEEKVEFPTQGNEIRFVMWKYYNEHNELFRHKYKVIFDDIDLLFPAGCLDTISVTNWNKKSINKVMGKDK